MFGVYLKRGGIELIIFSMIFEISIRSQEVCKYIDDFLENHVSHMNDNSLVKHVYIELSLLHLCGFDTRYGRARELVQKYLLEPNVNSQKLKKTT